MRSTLGLYTAVALATWIGCATPVRAGGPTNATDKPANPNAPALEWLEYGAALEQGKKANKHVLVDFYTTWCGWCKVMDNKTYGDSATAAYLKSHFVLSKVNAESPKRFKVGKETVSGVELAREFQVGSFPITWFIQPDGTKIDKVAGFVPPEKFLKVLAFVHERSYEKKR